MIVSNTILSSRQCRIYDYLLGNYEHQKHWDISLCSVIILGQPKIAFPKTGINQKS